MRQCFIVSEEAYINESTETVDTFFNNRMKTPSMTGLCLLVLQI